MYRLIFLYVTAYLIVLSTGSDDFSIKLIEKCDDTTGYCVREEENVDDHEIYTPESDECRADEINGYCKKTTPPRIFYYFFTDNYPEYNRFELKINDHSSFNQTFFNPEHPTVFITHDYKGNHDDEACRQMRNAYLSSNFDLNVIVVDWSALGSWDYVYNVRHAGKHIGKMIQFMVDNHWAKFDKIVLTGYGVGAHIMGIAGYTTGGKVEAIFGLDPAKKGFEKAGPGYRISKKDAKHVQIIHTNMGINGIDQILGHVDFVVNDGVKQPGCQKWSTILNVNIDDCSHKRAFEYFVESINSKVGFWGKKCDPISEVTNCLGENVRRMGGVLPDTDNLSDYEVYGVTTAGSDPFTLGTNTKGTAFILNWFKLYHESFMELSSMVYGN